MWTAIKRFFGYGLDQPATVEEPRDSLSQRPTDPIPTKPRYTKASVNRARYYRRGGDYYDVEDDLLVMDLELVMILMQMFTAEDDLDYIEESLESAGESISNETYDSDEIAITAVEPETTVSEIDAAVEQVEASMDLAPDPVVAASIPDPVVAASIPEPSACSYVGSSSYSGGGSSYSGDSSSSSD